MRKHIAFFILCLLMSPVLPTNAAPVPTAREFTVADVFTDNMVLQRDKEIHIWGTGKEEGAVIQVFLDETPAFATVENGAWEVVFPPRGADGKTFLIQILGGMGAEHIFIENVVMGDVYLVLGQSNVEYNATAMPDWDSISPSIPYTARVLTYTSTDLAEAPPNGYGGRQRMWKTMNPYSAAGASALGVCFTAAIAPQAGLDVPIGLISAGFYGQDLAAFLPPEIAQNMDATGVKSRVYQNVLCGLERFPIRAMLWYQGEANNVLYQKYTDCFQAFITYLRERMGHFPVYIIELAPCFSSPEGGDDVWQFMDFGTIRGVLGAIPLSVEDTFVCPTSDLWADRSFPNNLHPPNKPAVAARAAAIVAAKEYGIGVPPEELVPTIAEICYGTDHREVLLRYQSPVSTWDGTFSGFSAIDREWQEIENIFVSAVDTKTVRITADRDICIVRYGCIADDVFTDTLTLQSLQGIPAPALWYELTPPDRPSIFSFALLYAVAYRRYILGAVFIAACVFWIYKKRKKEKKCRGV